jgi:hypothetical protein
MIEKPVLDLIIARAVLPEVFGKSEGDDPHLLLQTRLAKHFNGWTGWPSVGGWRNGEGEIETEQSRTYEVAISIHDRNVFRDIIAQWGHAYGQESVYVVVDGKANLLPTKDRDYSVVRD